MEKLLKFFPLLPEKDNVGKFVLALVFYVFAPPIASAVVCIVLSITIIGLSLIHVVSVIASLYTIAGALLSFAKFKGIDIKDFFKEN